MLVDLDSPINQDIQINRHYIYAMSETKVCQCVIVDLDSPINQDIQINRHYIYAMSETKVCQCVSRSR